MSDKLNYLIHKYRNYSINTNKKYREMMNITDEQYKFILYVRNKLIGRIKSKGSYPILTREDVEGLIKDYFPDEG